MKKLLIVITLCLPLAFAIPEQCQDEYRAYQYAQIRVDRAEKVYREARYELYACGGWLECIRAYTELQRADARLDQAKDSLRDARAALEHCLARAQ